MPIGTVDFGVPGTVGTVVFCGLGIGKVGTVIGNFPANTRYPTVKPVNTNKIPIAAFILYSSLRYPCTIVEFSIVSRAFFCLCIDKLSLWETITVLSPQLVRLLYSFLQRIRFFSFYRLLRYSPP